MDRNHAKSSLRELCVWTIAAFLLVGASRIVFGFLYARGRDGSETAVQFLRGFQFDFATLALFLTPALLVPFVSGPRSLRAVRLVLWTWYSVLTMILAASVFNFSVNAKHLGWEFFAYLGNFGHLFAGVIVQMPVGAVLYMFVVPAACAAGWYVTGRQAAAAEHADGTARGTSSERRTSRLTAAALVESAFILFLLLSVRGGFQKSPLRPGDAMRSTDAALNNLPLNGLFTILRDSGDDADFQTYFKPEENLRVIRGLLENGDPFLSEKYPLLRWMPERPGPAGRQPNVILVILESYTSRYLAMNGGDPRIAPNFDRLMKGGLYFARCSSTGGRSANGIFAMMAGIPDRAGRTILRSAQIQNRFGGLPGILGRKGYASFFVHGGDLAFDHLDSFLPHIGFQKAVGHRQIHESGCCGAPAMWGYHDEAAFETVLRIADTARRPFLGVVFTQNTHHPYLLPDARFRIFGPEIPRHDFLNAYHYTDAALGDFMEKARRSRWFSDTVFVFIADHPDHAGLNYVEDREVPLLFYAPGRIAPGRRTDVASQLDILPTILGFAGGGFPYSSTGRDLFRADGRKAFAFFAGGSETDVVGWAEDDVIFAKWLRGGEPGLARSVPPLGGVDDPARKDRLFQQTLHMQQFVRTLERENRLWPDERELPLLLRTNR